MPPAHFPQEKTPRLVRISKNLSGGLIKNKKQAYTVIVFLVVSGLIYTVYTFATASSPDVIEKTEYAPTEGYGGETHRDSYR